MCVQFVGLLGQSFQVHGIDRSVYALISDADVAVNSRFVYLSSGTCLRDQLGRPLYTCWTHAGSYLQTLAVQTAQGDRLMLRAGGAHTGFANITLNGRQMAIGDTAEGAATTTTTTTQPLTVRYSTLRSVTITNAGVWQLRVENSDGFLNIVRLTVTNMTRLVDEVRSHGLIGQTWRDDQKGEQVRQIDGTVDDYAVQDGDEYGTRFVYGRFQTL